MGPIGVFDSGYGGLTILQEFKTKLPQYDYLYLGDNARAPYGNRSFDVVYQFTLEAVEELFSRGCELVILACNTASAKALRSIQQKNLPSLAPNKRVLGVIRPSAEIIGNYTKSGKIGILATQGTVNSESYVIEINKFFPDVEVIQYACPLWVPLIENNTHETPAGKDLIRQDVENLLSSDPEIDTIVLGCTHYPVLKEYIETLIPPHIQVIAQGEIVAESLADYLMRHPEMESRCAKNGTIQFLTTEDAAEFDRNAGNYFSMQIRSERIFLGEVKN